MLIVSKIRANELGRSTPAQTHLYNWSLICLRRVRVELGQDKGGSCGSEREIETRNEATDMAAQLLDTFDFGLLGAPSEQDGMMVWLFRRNCSISPRQLLAFFISLSVVSLLVALMCWVGGATLVTPFTVLELVVLGAALWVYARHAGDRERVSISAHLLVVEWENAGVVERVEFNPRWVRIVVSENGLVEISGGGQRAFVGRYTRGERRERLARDLRRAMLAA